VRQNALGGPQARIRHGQPIRAPEGSGPLWSCVLDALQASLPPTAIREIAAQSQPLHRTPSELALRVADFALERWISQGWIARLIRALEVLTHGTLDLAILPGSAQTFEDFEETPANRLARAGAEEITVSPGRAPAITMFHGPAGSGKTHLLRAIQRRSEDTRPGAPAVLRNVHDLSLDLIGALHGDRFSRLRDELRDAPILLLDGGESLAGRSLTQEELLEVLDYLGEREHPVVLGARSEIFDDGCLQPILRKGRLFRLHPSATRANAGIVSRRLSSWGLEDPERAAVRILTRLAPDLGELDRLITCAFSRCRSLGDLHHCELPESPRRTAPSQRAPVDPRSVLRIVCEHFDLRPAELRTSSRSPRVTLPRQLAMYLMRRHSSLSYPEIGQRFHRHHTTAIHACRRISSERDRKSDLRATLDLLEKELVRLLDEENRG
jgi:chromosomal replication initiator protein